MAGEVLTRSREFLGVVEEDGTIPNVQNFLDVLAETGLYWIILTYGPDWGMVVQRIVDDFLGDEDGTVDPMVFRQGLYEDFPVYGRFELPGPRYVHMLSRAAIPPEVLSVRFGVGLDRVMDAEFIKLTPTQAMLGKGLPKPTVGEYGQSTAVH